jgi:cell pole-organizing protein PopZ
MSDPTAQEPTMEEILASIRRIISEDDAPAAEPPATAAAEPEPAHHEPEPALSPPEPTPIHAVAPPPPPEEEEDDVLELTEPAPLPAETHGDLDVFAAEPTPAPPPPPEVKAPEPAPPPPKPIVHEETAFAPSFSGAALDEDRLISGGTEDKAASHFGKLSQSVAMPAYGRTLEDVVAELLKPLLKDWLDEHLPGIVEEKVQAEVDRISRRRV